MFIIVYDFGSSSVKTCLFSIDSEITLLAGASADYNMYFSDDGGSEQDTEEWWTALCSTTREVLRKSGLKSGQIEGISFCTQMQGTVLVDKNGNALRRPMNYLDHKGVKEYKGAMGSGLVKLDGCNARMTVRNLSVNKTGSFSSQDPVWKYKWVENNEPDVFSRVYKWLDIGDYLVARCTGRIVRTVDSAFATFLYDARKGRWDKGLLKMYKVNPAHMPEVIDCTEAAGSLTQKAAGELGLREGIPVFAAGDATITNIGAGSARPGDTHIYIGTSGWVITFMDYQTVDLFSRIGGIVSVKHGYYIYYAQLETAGKCFEWVMKHLALDEIGVYLEHTKITDVESKYLSLYDYLSDEVSKVPPGANGVIFTPWMHGNRCPFEDSKVGGMFFNLRIENGKRDMIRAVLEGICYHLRWLLELSSRRVKTSQTIRFVGGGALSPVTCQILADITGRKIETISIPQSAGAIGSALVVAAGIRGEDVFDLSCNLVKANHVYVPNPANREVYDRHFRVFKRLYKSNAKNFRDLNKGE